VAGAEQKNRGWNPCFHKGKIRYLPHPSFCPQEIT
jgi:hypothetical protein